MSMEFSLLNFDLIAIHDDVSVTKSNGKFMRNFQKTMYRYLQHFIAYVYLLAFLKTRLTCGSMVKLMRLCLHHHQAEIYFSTERKLKLSLLVAFEKDLGNVKRSLTRFSGLSCSVVCCSVFNE